MTVALSCEDVSVSLGERAVLKRVSFEVRRGEVVGLLGRNGAGKTTLLRAVANGLPGQGGRVVVFGRLQAAWRRRDLARRVAVVPQDLHVPFPFGVAELVLMGRAPHQRMLSFESADDVARANDALERLGIAHLANRSALDLSGGERQLVLLARALVQEPQLLLLDEPTAFLDLSHRTLALRIVRELAAEGCAVLVVSHDLTLSARACDRLVLLREGEVDLSGPPGEVIDAANLSRVFGLEAEVVAGPDGAPLVVPRLSG
jgi:iron complex transport system ATP-binding protein